MHLLFIFFGLKIGGFVFRFGVNAVSEFVLGVFGFIGLIYMYIHLGFPLFGLNLHTNASFVHFFGIKIGGFVCRV